MKILFTLVLALFVASGCTPRTTTLEDEVASHPDVWARHWQWGASSNHWALLDRVVAVDDVQRRIRLVTALRNRLRRTPEEMLADCGNLNVFDQRIHFARSCAERVEGKDKDPTALATSWKLEASWIDDVERLMELTEKDWYNERGKKWDAPLRDREIRAFSAHIRRLYELFFEKTFSSCVGTYNRLPESARPAFVEQIKRDFFHRRGMKYVDMNDFPPAFRK